MYSIGEVSRLTGITAHTLRFYEKIGVLPAPERKDGKKNGIRTFNDQDVQFIRFIHGLKNTGMKLEVIATFAEDGCLLTQNHQDIDISGTLQKRLDILDVHIEQLEQQMKHLETVKTIAQGKRSYYAALLKEQASVEPAHRRMLKNL